MRSMVSILPDSSGRAAYRAWTVGVDGAISPAAASRAAHLRQLQAAMREVFDEVSDARCKTLLEAGIRGSVYLHQDYERCMREACQMRRVGLANNRAEALEMSYDYLVQLATKGNWTRVGEVFIDRDHNRVSAVCSRDAHIEKEIYA